MDAKQNRLPWYAVAVLVTGLLVVTPGCVGLLAQVLYWSGGAEVPPEFDGLEGKRVAVVCVADSASSFGPGTDTLFLARSVGKLLREKVEEIDVVRPDEIADWIDRHDWNEVDFAEVGRGVKADMVLAIELTGLSLYDGQTLYKGRANLKFRVLDLADEGKEIFSRKLPEVTFPATGAYAATDASEPKFRQMFLQVLAERIARHFYTREMWDDYSTDPTVIS